MAEVIDVFATERHYWAHLGPVWRALDPHVRGHEWGVTATERGRRAAPHGDGPAVLVASGGDARQVPPQRKLIHLQHGVAQTYGNGGAPEAGWGYAGGPDLDHVDVFLCTNTHEAALWRARYPNAAAYAVGAPTLDEWHERTFPITAVQPPWVAFSFHWQCTAAVEAGSAWQDWRRVLTQLCARADRRYRILGHEHPRWRGRLLKWWEGIADETTADWGEVMRRASVYFCDNSSTMYEFAATDRPVIGLRAHRWRNDVEHGLRFGELAPPLDLDPVITDVSLHRVVRNALVAPTIACPREWRAKATQQIYGKLDGLASQRAARVIEEVLGCDG